MSFLKFLDGRMVKPLPFGWYHFMWIGICIVTVVAAAMLLKKSSNRQHRIIMGFIAISCIIFEVYKQVIFSVDTATGEWSYRWYAFPFQFCSTPMYVALFAAFLPEGKVRDALQYYLATFGLFAGLVVMIIIGDVYTTSIGVNIQTMYVHSMMIIMGVYLWSSGRVKVDHKKFLSAIVVFAITAATAEIFNISFHLSGITGGEEINMFFISPYYANGLPVLGALSKMVPFPVYLLLYLICFSLAAYIVFCVAWLAITAAARLRQTKRAVTEPNI